MTVQAVLTQNSVPYDMMRTMCGVMCFGMPAMRYGRTLFQP